nr:uncharacterized protein LOC129466803 [Symphalangus syndactylus]
MVTGDRGRWQEAEGKRGAPGGGGCGSRGRRFPTGQHRALEPANAPSPPRLPQRRDARPMGGGRAAAWCSRLAPAPGGRGTGGEFMNGECGAGEAGARGGAAHVTALAARPLRAPGAARSAARRPRCALGWVWLAPRRPPPPLPFRRGRGAEPALPGAHSARGAAPRTRRGGRAPPPAHRHDSPRPVLRSQGRSSGCPGIHDSAARGAPYPGLCPFSQRFTPVSFNSFPSFTVSALLLLAPSSCLDPLLCYVSLRPYALLLACSCQDRAEFQRNPRFGAGVMAPSPVGDPGVGTGVKWFHE